MLEQACSPVSPGDATRKEEIHRLTRVTARGLRLPLQASNIRQGSSPHSRQAGVTRRQFNSGRPGSLYSIR